MSNLIYSINATLPIFLLIILGKVLKTTKIINDEFTKTADRYVFRIALPALFCHYFFHRRFVGTYREIHEK